MGSDIETVCLRRRLMMKNVSQRAFISRSTLQKLEAGNPGVSMGIYASVISFIGP
jgi:DNA-binding Xre family transcriptional regulator